MPSLSNYITVLEVPEEQVPDGVPKVPMVLGKHENGAVQDFFIEEDFVSIDYDTRSVHEVPESVIRKGAYKAAAEWVRENEPEAVDD
jgi:hypothetical protein